MLKRIFRYFYRLLYLKSGKGIKINNEDYNVSAYVARGINSVIDETPLKLLINLSRNAETVFDIGGNIGVIAVILAKKMQPGTTIYSFEPAPLSYQYLEDTARVQKGNARIITVNNAVSNNNEKLAFTNDGNSCTNHISTQQEEGTVLIDAITIDSFCEKSKVIPQVMKIDIEGAEYWALEGMQKTLKNNNCMVLVEIHGAFLTENHINGAMFGNIVDNIGYKVYNTKGEEIRGSEIMENACVILAKSKPDDAIFKIN